MKHIIKKLFLGTLCMPLGATEVISQPGRYVFGGDVVDTISAPGTIIVEVTASHVTVDFDGHSVYQDMATSDTTSVGVFIHPGLIDVTIHNGTIGAINGIGVIVSQGCSDIVLSDVIINDCTAGAVHAVGTPAEPIDGISFIGSECITSGTCANPFVAGFYAKHVFNVYAQNSHFSRNNGGDGYGFGIYCQNCSTLDFSDCRMSNNKGSSAAGVYFDHIVDARFDKCTLLRNGTTSSNSTSFGYGLFLKDSNNVMALNSTFAASYAITGTACNARSQNSSHIGFLNCLSIAGTGYLYAAGFALSQGSACAVINSIAQGNRALSGSAYGIHYSDITAGYLRSNTVLNTTGSSAFGIVDTTSPSTTFLAENYAFNNATNYVVTYTTTVTLPLVIGDLGGGAGLPAHQAGMIDNVSVN